MEPVEPVQMSIYLRNTYRKELSWLHFDDEPRVKERQQVKDQQFCKSVFVAYVAIPGQENQPSYESSIPCKTVW